jgi:dephospho-CoA kinase
MTKIVIGLTGGIGTGKTTAATILAGLGAVIVDCDQLGRDVARSDGAAFGGIVERFGPDIVGPDGELDRAGLGAIVFNDPVALTDLNSITHPAIDAEIASAVRAAPPGSVVVLDMAVLVESDLGAGQYNQVLVVESPIEQRLERLATQRNMSPADANARIDSQASDSERRAVADDVVVNDGSHDDLEAALTEWWNELTSRR